MQARGFTKKRAAKCPTHERRNHIVSSVMRLVYEKGGPEFVTCAAIAEDLGLAQNALFKHFAGMSEVWEAVVDDTKGKLGQVWDHAEQSVELDASVRTRMESLAKAHLSFVWQTPGLPMILSSRAFRDPGNPLRSGFVAAMDRFADRLATLLREASNSGEMRPGLVSVKKQIGKRLAWAFIGMMQSTSLRLASAEHAPDLNFEASFLVDLFWDGVGHLHTRII